MEEPVKTDTPTPTPDNGWQPAVVPENAPITTEGTPNPGTEDPTQDLAAILADMMWAADGWEPKKDEPVPEKPEDEVAKIKTELAESKKFQETHAPIAAALEKDPLLAKFMDWIVKGKVTFAGLFAAYATAQSGKTPPKIVPGGGNSPAPAGGPSLQARLQVARQNSVNGN